MEDLTGNTKELIESRRKRRRGALIALSALMAATSFWQEVSTVRPYLATGPLNGRVSNRKDSNAAPLSNATLKPDHNKVKRDGFVRSLDTWSDLNASAAPSDVNGAAKDVVGSNVDVRVQLPKDDSLNATSDKNEDIIDSNAVAMEAQSGLLNITSNHADSDLNVNETLSVDGSVNSPSNISETVQQPWAALCAVMKDEDLYISEWTDYHLALGFEHIFIYDSHPNFTLSTWYAERQEKEAEEERPTNTTTDRVHLTHRILPESKNVQELVYGECLEQLRALPVPPKWVMVLDGDEFLVFRDMDRYPNVTTFLSEHLQQGSLQINWVVMGSSNETHYRDEPVTKRFQLATSASKSPETKAVAILDHVTGWRVHYAYHKPGYNGIGMGGRKVGLAGALCCIKDGDVSVAAVFHYKYKSYGEFNRKQCERGDIYYHVKHTCPPTVDPGNVHDDSAWRALTRLLPRYASYDGTEQSINRF